MERKGKPTTSPESTGVSGGDGPSTGLLSGSRAESGSANDVALRLEVERTSSLPRLPSRPLANSREAFYTIVNAWVSRKFVLGVCILFPVAITFYITWWFLTFFDNFFSPLYYHLFSFHVFGLGFMTSMGFILCVGVFFSSWLGNLLLNLGEWIIKRLPLIRHIYSASKQVSAALNPENEAAKAFQECVLIRHPRQGEYAFGFITGRTVLQAGTQDVRLTSVYVPTNHVYIGDVFLLEDKDIIHTNLSVREGLEVVVSVGMAVPPNLVEYPVHRPNCA